MPVEIRELVIRAIVAEERPSERDQWDQLDNRNNEGKDQLIEECVRQVLKILNRGEER